MTTTEIERLGERILSRHGLPTHVTVLSPWQPLMLALRTQYVNARRIAKMWQEEEARSMCRASTR